MTAMTDAERYIFDTAGVLIRRQAFSVEEVERARYAITNKIGPNEWKFPILSLNNVFWTWMTDDKLFLPAQEMCGPHVRLDHAFGVRGGVEVATAQLHGGPDSSQYSCFYHDVGREVGLIGQLSVGVCLRGQNSTTGGFCYLPGSHKAINRAEGKTVFKDLLKNKPSHPAIVVPQIGPGDLIYFSESLVHGDTGPFIRHERMMAYYKFCPGWMCWRDPVQQEKYKSLAPNERALRLLEPPWTGRFDDDNNTMSVKNTRREPTS